MHDCAYQSIRSYTGNCEERKANDIRRQFHGRKLHIEYVACTIFNKAVKLILDLTL
jgi:hypothetical protein